MGKLSLKSHSQGFRGASLVQLCSRYVNVFVTLAVTMVLARILTPEQYGVMAVIAVFLGLFSVISNMGIGAAVVQYHDLTDEDCSGLLSFTALAGLVLAFAFMLFSIPVSFFYGSSEYMPLMSFASLGVLFHSMNMVPNGILLRDKLFFAAGMRLVVTSVVSGAVAVALALNGWGVYALVANTVLQSVLSFLWNVLASGLKVGNRHFVAPLRRVLRFSVFQFSAQVTQYLIRNLDNLLLGVFLGPTQLGFYDKAYKIARYPIDIIPGTLNPVLKSFFASAEGDKDRIYGMFFKIEKALSISGVFATVLCFCCPTEIVLLFFGDQWGASVEPFRLLSASIVFQMMNYVVFSVLEGFKRTDYLLAHTAITGLMMVIALVIGLQTGSLVIVAGLVSLCFVLTSVPFLYFVIKRAFGMNIWEYVKCFIPEFVIGVIVGGILLLFNQFLPQNYLLSFVAKLMIGAVLYGLGIWRTGQLKYLKMIFRR